MAESVDPYHVWLGIPPDEQPPHHYRLLAIQVFEENVEVIRDAVAQRMAHVRTYQLGPHSALSQRILNELGVAAAALLDPARKANYDDWLRQTLGAQGTTEEPLSLDNELLAAIERVAPTPRAPFASQQRGVIAVAGLLAVLLTVGFLLWMGSVREKSVRGKPATVEVAEPKPSEKPAPTAVPPHAPKPVPPPESGLPPEATLKPTPSRNEQTLPADWVVIVNRGTALILRDDPVRIEQAGDYYKLRCHDSGKYVALAGWACKEEYASKPPQNRHQRFLRSVLDSNNPLMLWEIKPLGNKFWSITNRASGKCLEMRKGKPLRWQSPFRDGALEQQWRFVPIEGDGDDGKKPKGPDQAGPKPAVKRNTSPDDE